MGSHSIIANIFAVPWSVDVALSIAVTVAVAVAVDVGFINSGAHLRRFNTLGNGILMFVFCLD